MPSAGNVYVETLHLYVGMRKCKEQERKKTTLAMVIRVKNGSAMELPLDLYENDTKPFDSYKDYYDL